ncbi:MAG: LptF/LptG family permease [Limisphaerales bacterium]
MRTLHSYLLREILIVLGIALGVFVGVLLLGNAVKEVVTMLVNRQVTIGTVLKVFALYLPWLLSFALPLGFLAAVLLVFGRLSADQEIIAVRAGGASLSTLAWPVVLLAVLACALSAWVNLDLGPRCRIAVKQETRNLAADPLKLIVPGRYIRDFKGWTIYVAERDGNVLKRVVLYGLDENGKQKRHIEAARGEISVDESGENLKFRIHDARFFLRTGDVAALTEDGQTPEITSTQDPGWVTYSQGETVQEIAIGELLNRVIKPDLNEMTHHQLRVELDRVRKEGIDDGLVIFHLHRQVASSFACFAFMLVGIPLGIRTHRRETSVGLAMALGVAMLYYLLHTFAQALENRPEFYPHLLNWLPNFLFVGLGGWLFWRANRGAGF